MRLTIITAETDPRVRGEPQVSPKEATEFRMAAVPTECPVHLLFLLKGGERSSGVQSVPCHVGYANRG